MFNKLLNEVTLANDLANQAFVNVAGDSYLGDRSFVATLRALLLPRVSGDDQVHLIYGYSNYAAFQIRTHGLNTIVNNNLPGFRPGYLIVHNARSPVDDDRKALFDAFDEGFVKQYSDFKELTDIREFVAAKLDARFYVNEQNRCVVIVVDSMTPRKWHYIQSFIPRYLPWYFADSPYTPEERDLLVSLIKKDPSEYEKLIEKFADKFDMRAKLIESVIGGLEKKAREVQVRDVDSNIEDLRNQIDTIQREYATAIARLDDLNLRRMGLIDAINNAGDSNELVEYFTANKSLEPVFHDGMMFSFIVRTYLDTWDPELYERLTKTRRSQLFSGYTCHNPVFEKYEDRKKFLDSIYNDDPKLRIKMCGFYKLDLRGRSMSERDYDYPKSCEDYTPNPHLQRFACLGNHEHIINGFLRDHNYIAAIEQCVASCKSMNLTEPQTYQWFFERLFNSSAKCIELPDGSSVTPTDAMKWLLDQEKEDKKEAEHDA